jgi:hypothetical protein
MAQSHLRDTEFWQSLVTDRFGKRALSKRQWNAMFGLPLSCIGPTWDKYMCNPPPSSVQHLAPLKELDFLRMLNWMKVYSNEDDMAVKWGCSKPQFRRSCLNTVQFLGVTLDEVCRAASALNSFPDPLGRSASRSNPFTVFPLFQRACQFRRHQMPPAAAIDGAFPIVLLLGEGRSPLPPL